MRLIFCTRSPITRRCIKETSRIITRADGLYLWDSEGTKILDCMAGLWCTAVGYGRKELADAAAAQMMQLPFYNAFFKTATPPAIELAARLAKLVGMDMNMSSSPPRVRRRWIRSSGWRAITGR
jgi:adenosylmethionine-8-amino-7-oxononanoate aminotransferase